MKKPLVGVILAGGGGLRLWPLSRQDRPKQFLRLFRHRSLLQETGRRLSNFIPASRTYVVTHTTYGKRVEAELPQIPRKNILLEPAAKSTALAIGFATAVIAEKHPGAIIASVAADHVVSDDRAFTHALLRAAAAASTGPYLVTVGIRPTHPHTGYGYIHRGGEVGGSMRAVYEVRKFVEKPDATTAERYLASGKYFWNASYFIFQAETMLDAYDALLPTLSSGLSRIRASFGQKDTHRVLARIYEHAKEVPIETGIFERAKNVLVVPGNFPWSDIGDWNAIAAMGAEEKDRVDLGSVSTFVHGNGRLVATVGLDNLVIVDTDDVVFVCDRSRTQEVKQLVEKLKQSQTYAKYV